MGRFLFFVSLLFLFPKAMKKLLYILLFVPLALFGQENYSLSFNGVDDKVYLNNI